MDNDVYCEVDDEAGWEEVERGAVEAVAKQVGVFKTGSEKKGNGIFVTDIAWVARVYMLT